MATLTLKALYCVETEDITGADSPYLLVNGSNKWSGRLNNQQNVDLLDKNKNPLQINFEGEVNIRLMEDDGNHWYDRNDVLGNQRVLATDKGDHFVPFTEDDAIYYLSYSVT